MRPSKEQLAHWGYATEIILAAILTLIVTLTVQPTSMATSLTKLATVGGTIFAGAACAAFGIPLATVAVFGKGFRQLLSRTGAIKVLVIGAVVSCLFFLLAAIAITLVSEETHAPVLVGIVFFVLLGVLNMLTVATNTIELVALAQKLQKDGLLRDSD